MRSTPLLLLAAFQAAKAGRADANARHAASGTIPNPGVNVLLSAYVNSTGARCLDGSPQQIWVAQAPAGSPNANKWVLGAPLRARRGLSGIAAREGAAG
jgi:hypothetical protein